MSDVVSAWIKQHGPHRQPHYGVLREIGDHTGERNGIDIAYAYPGVDTIARESRWKKNTVLESLEWLELHDYILVRHPYDRGRGPGTGRHNEYVVVMDRDARQLAADLGWPYRGHGREGSATRTDRKTAQPGGHTAVDGRDTAADPTPDAPDGHTAAQAAPAAISTTQATEPVDDAPPRPVDRSATRTRRRSTGSGKVRDRSEKGPSRGTELELEPEDLSTPGSCSVPDRGHARDTVRPVDDPVGWLRTQQ